MTEETITIFCSADPWDNLPPGNYCIVEQLGHATLVGKYAEVDQFGTKMMAIDVLFNGEMLPPIFIGGSTIYRLTPCSAKVAWERQPKHTYQIPQALAATIPDRLLNGPTDLSDKYPDYEDSPPPRAPRCGKGSAPCQQRRGHEGVCDEEIPF